MLSRYPYPTPLIPLLLALLLIAFLPSLLSPRKTNSNAVISPTIFSPSQKRKVVYWQYSQYPKVLIFQGEIEEKGNGQLLLVDTKSARIDGRFLARSGIGGKERDRAYGPLPSNLSAGFSHYTVSIKPLILAVPGIEGAFYQILPFNFSFAGTTRGDFGIHADKRGPGTLGCIGLDSPGWERFKKAMVNLDRAGLTKIPLLVSNY